MGAWRYTPPGRPINFLTWPRRCAKARASPTSAASTSRKPRPSTIPIFKSRSNGQPESRQMAYGWLHASDLHQSAISASTSGSTQLLSRPRRPPKPLNPAPDPPSTPSKTEDYEANPKNEGAAALAHNLAQAGTPPPTTRPPAPSPQSPAPSSSAPPPATPDFGSHLLANLYLFFSGRLLAELFKEAADTGEAPG